MRSATSSCEPKGWHDGSLLMFGAWRVSSHSSQIRVRRFALASARAWFGGFGAGSFTQLKRTVYSS
jgi:hypothetical protein